MKLEAIEDITALTNEELLKEIDFRISGCVAEDCHVCPRTILIMKEIAKRLNLNDFKPHLEILRKNSR